MEEDKQELYKREAQEPEAKYRSVMLIDDNKIDNFISRMTIEDAHFATNINTFTSAEKALAFLCQSRAERGAEDHTPDLIFLDINMPGMNGFRFLEELEKINPECRAGIRIIMLSSSTNPADIDRAMQFETVHKYLVKPLSEESLELL